jgi:hypothetical protein
MLLFMRLPAGAEWLRERRTTLPAFSTAVPLRQGSGRHVGLAAFAPLAQAGEGFPVAELVALVGWVERSETHHSCESFP